MGGDNAQLGQIKVEAAIKGGWPDAKGLLCVHRILHRFGSLFG